MTLKKRGPQKSPKQLYPTGLTKAFSPPSMPAYALFEQSATMHPERVCLDFLGATLTYVEVQGRITRFAAGLQKLGVEKGDRVALCLPNTPYAVIAFYAVLRIGAVVVNINPLLTEREVEDEITDSGAKVAITVNLKPILAKLRRLHPLYLKHIVVCSLAAALPPLQRTFFHILRVHQIAHMVSGPGLLSYEDLSLPGTHPKPVAINPAKDLALLQYTGGTTGVPKAAMLTHRNLVANTLQIKLWLGETSPEGEKFLTVLPLFHVFALSAGLGLAMSTASTLVLLPAFNLKQLLSTMRRTQPTIFPGVPPLFNVLANHPGIESYPVKSIKWCISGGAPLPLAIKQRWEALTEAPLVEGYGLTEASPVVACNPRPEPHLPQGGVGLPLPGTTVEIRHLKSAKKLKVGETGEVYVSGPQVMRGYWKNPKETAQVLKRDWLRTGDIGHLDKNGYLHITDRLKDMIISNGYNIYPRKIEEIAYRHPAVAEVSVIAIPHSHKGQVPKVYVSLKQGTTATEAELLAYLRENTNPIERPAAVEIRATLPKTFAGKLSKKELKAEVLKKR